MSFVGADQDSKEFLPRYRLVYGLLAFTFAVFFMRLWYLQIISGAELRQFSETNSIKETKITAPRGIVYDRDGQILVENLPGYQVVLSPQYLTNLDATAQKLGEILNMPALQIVSTIQKSRRVNGPFTAVKLKDNLSREEIFAIELMRLDYTGVEIKETVLRSYPLKESGAQVFGYVGEVSKRQMAALNEKPGAKYKFSQGDIVGKTGLEGYLDLDLRGRDGISVMQVDVRGREAMGSKATDLLGSMPGFQEAAPGKNVILTIDKDIQRAVYDAFTKDGRIGGAIVMKSNGEILAWVNAPAFDPNEFSAGISPEILSKLVNDPDKPMRNKAVQDHNPPGSTFKPLVAVAALNERIVAPTTVVPCPGAFKFGNRFYHDHLQGGHGNLVITQALERSSNVFFYKMGIGLGIDRMYKYISALGIGRRTGLEMGGETAGLMPSAEWKKETIGEEWQPGENLSVAIGQSYVRTTPLQMAVAYNAIGTEGKVVRPFIVKKILGADNKVEQEFSPQVLRDVGKELNVDPMVWKTVKEGLRLVVSGDRGTARVGARLPYIEVAGKTGTAQVVSFSADQIYAKCEGRPKHLRHHGWFIGYAPADNPEIAFGVLAEHACHGASGAAPVAKAAVAAYVAKYHPEWLGRDVHKKGTGENRRLDMPITDEVGEDEAPAPSLEERVPGE